VAIPSQATRGQLRRINQRGVIKPVFQYRLAALAEHLCQRQVGQVAAGKNHVLFQFVQRL